MHCYLCIITSIFFVEHEAFRLFPILRHFEKQIFNMFAQRELPNKRSPTYIEDNR